MRREESRGSAGKFLVAPILDDLSIGKWEQWIMESDPYVYSSSRHISISNSELVGLCLFTIHDNFPHTAAFAKLCQISYHKESILILSQQNGNTCIALRHLPEAYRSPYVVHIWAMKQENCGCTGEGERFKQSLAQFCWQSSL